METWTMAVELDIGRSTMYRMLKRYDIRDHE
jgi:transcriptional regulator of acetoin/glycerol metabolism